MKNHDTVFPEELEHLAMIQSRLYAALRDAEASAGRMDRQYTDTRQYMSAARGEIDPNEMFQTELLLKQADQTGAFAAEVCLRLAKLKDSPYFARIDFREKGSQDSFPYYIGRFSFRHGYELLIFDWRAPISGMFYDCEPGPAGYEAPAGKIDGELTKKRQFCIKDGLMEYAIESSSNIQDDVLQRELSRTSSEKMKSIISTIQKEQNQIIRNEHAHTLIIQGVAGSGKTSIALHRIAFLLYRLKHQLSARNVTILSPNKVFGDYISNVIPELGEEPIFELAFSDLAEIQLGQTVGFEPERDPLGPDHDEYHQRTRFKSTLGFKQLLDTYIKKLPNTVFLPSDCSFGGFTAKKEWIQKRFRAYEKHPVKHRLKMIADDICDLFASESIMEDDIPRAGTVLKNLTSMLTIKNSLALYKDFYKSLNKPSMLVLPSKRTLEWTDVFPYLYLTAAFEGLKESKITRHLVIDEMQDYTPVQYAVINLLFPCPKTILGDFGQSLNPDHLHTLEDLRRLYHDAEFVMLNKSYRSTYEIMSFAKQLQDNPSLEAVKRHGETPVITACGDNREKMNQIKKALLSFEKSGAMSLGLIAKTNEAAKTLYDILSKEFDLHLISPESSAFHNGISVTSVQMAKGLEFDEVLIPDADSDSYHTDYDRNLLYIACTRAMHRLTLMYVNELTCFMKPD